MVFRLGRHLVSVLIALTLCACAQALPTATGSSHPATKALQSTELPTTNRKSCRYGKIRKHFRDVRSGEPPRAASITTSNSQISVCDAGEVGSPLESRTHNHILEDYICEYPGLARAAEILYQPGDFFAGPATSPNHDIKSLPPVPGAILLGLVGFLCVSLVHDRKAYVALATGIILFCQTNLYAIPELACRRLTAGKGHAARLHAKQPLTQVNRLSFILAEKTRNFFVPNIAKNLKLQAVSVVNPNRSVPTNCLFIKRAVCVNSLSVILERILRFDSFSPAFIFANNPRGPPA